MPPASASPQTAPAAAGTAAASPAAEQAAGVAAGAGATGPAGDRAVGPVARRAWWLLLPVCLVVYATSFAGIPVVEQRHSVLGDADASSFRLLLEDFSLTRVYGDEYRPSGRTVGDIAQKHKIHHVLYNGVAGTLSRALQFLYGAAGLEPRAGIYAVNALITCLNIVLLALLLQGFALSRPIWPFLLLYAGALGTWIFASVPESWPFSATLVLLTLLVLQRSRFRPFAWSAGLGVAMLGNVMLAALFPLLCLRALRDRRLDLRLFSTMFLAGLLTVATWLAGLTALSLFDPAFRPDHFIAYTLWFRDFADSGLSPADPYVWASAFTNLLVNAVVSNQPDPAVPQEALLLTIRQSRLGLAATLAWLAITATALVGTLRLLLHTLRERRNLTVLGEPPAILLAWVTLMVLVTALAFHSSGFLYSCVVLPALTALCYRGLDARARWQQYALLAAIALILLNNAQQVSTFRDALLSDLF